MSRCRACNCVMTQDDVDGELCTECLGASGAEIRAPIPTDDSDLVDFIEKQYKDTDEPNEDEALDDEHDDE